MTTCQYGVAMLCFNSLGAAVFNAFLWGAASMLVLWRLTVR
jgi:hypothetical protein